MEFAILVISCYMIYLKTYLHRKRTARVVERCDRKNVSNSDHCCLLTLAFTIS